MSLSEGFQPLYKQVYTLLTKRLVDHYWKPSEPLPSEMALAKELGVSQGTVRKALNQMVSENLLERRQGKGTYVAEHTSERSLTRFWRLQTPGGETSFPETRILNSRRRQANSHECKALDLDIDALVVELTRLRFMNKEPVVIENVIQPLSIFPDIDKVPNLPNALYSLYQEKYGITVISVHDELRAVEMPAEYAEQLKLDAGAPVLMIERTSINIDGRAVEWSQAYCRTDHFVYGVNLR